MLKDFLWNRFRLRCGWFKMEIKSEFLDFSGCHIVGYNLKQEITRWLNENVIDWCIWSCEGDVYGVKIKNEADAIGFKLMYGK